MNIIFPKDFFITDYNTNINLDIEESSKYFDAHYGLYYYLNGSILFTTSLLYLSMKNKKDILSILKHGCLQNIEINGKNKSLIYNLPQSCRSKHDKFIFVNEYKHFSI